MCKKGTKTIYRIVVRGELSDRYAVAFEGMQMQTKDGRTILTGEVADQPHLHGILDRIGALGLKLVSVHDLSEDVHPSVERNRELVPLEPAARVLARRIDCSRKFAVGRAIAVSPTLLAEWWLWGLHADVLPSRCPLQVEKSS
jgi:hypothetical protein